MTDYKRRTHTDVQTVSTLESPGDKTSCRFGDRLETLDKEHRDTGNKLHHGSHLDSETEYIRNIVNYLFPALACQATDAYTDNDTEHKRFSEHTEFLFQPFGIDVYFVRTRNFVEKPVHSDCKRHETCAKRLWN